MVLRWGERVDLGWEKNAPRGGGVGGLTGRRGRLAGKCRVVVVAVPVWLCRHARPRAAGLFPRAAWVLLRCRAFSSSASNKSEMG